MRINQRIDQRINRPLCHRLALAGFSGLFLLMMLWPTLLVPNPPIPTALVLLVTVTPLLLPLRGLLAQQPKAYAWAAYISLPYFGHGVVVAYSDAQQRGYAVLEVLSSLLLFLGAVFYLRALKRSGGHG